MRERVTAAITELERGFTRSKLPWFELPAGTPGVCDLLQARGVLAETEPRAAAPQHRIGVPGEGGDPFFIHSVD
jgi:hypothetical protein